MYGWRAGSDAEKKWNGGNATRIHKYKILIKYEVMKSGNAENGTAIESGKRKAVVAKY